MLCRLVNALKPGAVGKIASGTMPFKQMENIAQYLRACSALGVPAFETFQVRMRCLKPHPSVFSLTPRG